MQRAYEFIIIQFQRFFDADEFFFYKMVKSKNFRSFCRKSKWFDPICSSKKKCHEKFSFISRKEDLDFKSATSEEEAFFHIFIRTT